MYNTTSLSTVFLLFQSGRDYELTHRGLHFLNPCYHSTSSLHTALGQATALHPITHLTASTSKLPLPINREPIPPNPLANPPLKNSLSYTHLEPFSQTSAPLYTQPSYGSGRSTTSWQAKSGSLGSLNEKTVPSYQVIIISTYRERLVRGEDVYILASAYVYLNIRQWQKILGIGAQFSNNCVMRLILMISSLGIKVKEELNLS